jgi:hypothetical protein
MKEFERIRYKELKGIIESSGKEQCKKCLYHTHERVCQFHGIITKNTEVCLNFTRKRRHRVYKGGGISPK